MTTPSPASSSNPAVVRTAGRGVVHVVLFAVGLFGCASLLRGVDSFPYWGWTRAKMAHLAAGAGDCDTLFFGSSRVQNGVMPQRFDERMAALGRPTRSFNAAMGGQRPHDFHHTVEWAIAHRSPRLRRVVVELHGWQLVVRAGDQGSELQLQMHSPGELVDRVRTIVDGTEPLAERLGQLGFVAQHTLWNLLRIGQGQRLLQQAFAPPDLAQWATEFVRDAGWSDAEQWQDAAVVRQRAAFRADAAERDRRLGAKVANPAPVSMADTFRGDLLREQAARLRQLGIETVFVVMPTWGVDFRGRDGVRELRRTERVLELDLPFGSPGLYEPVLWSDLVHLNRDGAAVFSELLAERLVELEALPLGAAAPGHATPPRQPTLAATWHADPPRLVFTADSLDVPGVPYVAIAERTADAEFAGIRMGVAMPPVGLIELTRSGLHAAHFAVEAALLPSGKPLFAQMVCVLDAAATAVGTPIRIEPRP